MATRCSSPPDSSRGMLAAAVAQGPRRRACDATRASAAASRMPSSASGNATFCATVQVRQHVERLEHEADVPAAKPRAARRRRARTARRRRPRRVPASARSRPAMRLSSVDLPTPDSPRIATISPARDVERDAREHGRGARAREGLRDVRRRGSSAEPSVSAAAVVVRYELRRRESARCVDPSRARRRCRTSSRATSAAGRAARRPARSSFARRGGPARRH